MKTGDRVRVWDEKKVVCYGWGRIIAIANRIGDRKEVPLIALEGENKKKIWGDECYWEKVNNG